MARTPGTRQQQGRYDGYDGEREGDAAQADGTLRPDVRFADIGVMLVRLSRPLPGAFSPEDNDRLAHRHLDLYIDGRTRLERLAFGAREVARRHPSAVTLLLARPTVPPDAVVVVEAARRRTD